MAIYVLVEIGQQGRSRSFLLHETYEGLRWPEHENGKEVGSGDECNDQGEGEDARILLQALREHWILCTISLPEHECHDEYEAKNQWDQDVC